jgi:hypothetical protein
MLFGPAIRNIQVKYFIDHDTDHRNSIFVAGMGRSGTTWLGELINYRNESRFVFEPFDPGRVALAVNFGDHTYLRATDDDPHFLSPARAIVTGLVREHFVDQHNRKIICGSRIIKEVRANLFLRWLYAHFPGMPLILIVRHPFAVAASRGKTGVDIDLQAQFLAQPNLVEDYIAPYVDIMNGCATKFERHIAAWCIEIGVPLSQFQPGEICVVAYEHLSTEPERVLTEVFAHAKRRLDPRVFKALKKPSSTTISSSELTRSWSEGADKVTQAWKDRISPDQVRRGLAIMEAFGISDMYDDGPLPLVEHFELAKRFGPRPIPKDAQRAAT